MAIEYRTEPEYCEWLDGKAQSPATRTGVLRRALPISWFAIAFSPAIAIEIWSLAIFKAGPSSCSTCASKMVQLQRTLNRSFPLVHIRARGAVRRPALNERDHGCAHGDALIGKSLRTPDYRARAAPHARGGNFDIEPRLARIERYIVILGHRCDNGHIVE